MKLKLKQLCDLIVGLVFVLLSLALIAVGAGIACRTISVCFEFGQNLLS